MRLSVLLAVWRGDCPAYLREALRSVWDDQLRKPDQIVLVEDGPVGAGLGEVVQDWKARLGARLTLASLPTNRGLGAALNEGLRHCTGELVARMDADDVCLPARFSIQLSRFEADPSLDVVGAYAIEIVGHGEMVALRRMPGEHKGIVDNLWACPFIHPTVMFKRDRIEALGGYDPTLLRAQDYDLWFRCAKAGMRFENIGAPLLLYRFDETAHAKQPIRLALQQAMVGFKWSSSFHMSWRKRLGCFVPLFRAFLPLWLQHRVYRGMRRYDPRYRTTGMGR